MPLHWIDIGVNITSKRFRKDRDAVLTRAAEAGVETLIFTGTDLESSLAVADMAQSIAPSCYATAGTHPHHADHFDDRHAEAIHQLAGQPTTVAIGETGLDFNRDFSARDAQEEAFHAQLRIAVETGLPVFLHQRDAHDRFLAILKQYRDKLAGAVVHCFTEGPEELRDYLALDCHIGVTGWVCDPDRGSALRAATALIPENRLMLETDAPWLVPRDMDPKPKGGRNEPAFLPHIAQRVAELKNLPLEQLSTTTVENTRRFFGLA